jgi:hypothetical protein
MQTFTFTFSDSENRGKKILKIGFNYIFFSL